MIVTAHVRNQIARFQQWLAPKAFRYDERTSVSSWAWWAEPMNDRLRHRRVARGGGDGGSRLLLPPDRLPPVRSAPPGLVRSPQSGPRPALRRGVGRP